MSMPCDNDDWSDFCDKADERAVELWDAGREDEPTLEKCSQCDGSGEIARSIYSGAYVCAGPVPEYARGVSACRCDACGGHGWVEYGAP